MIIRHLSNLIRSIVGILLILTHLLMALPAQAAAASTVVIHVSPTGTDGSGCGGSWNSPCSLDYALKHAEVGSEIWIRQGTYTNRAQNEPFIIPSGTAVYGGFAGSEDQRDQRDWYRNLTILSGDIQHNDLPNGSNRADNSIHVVTLPNTSASTRLDGFVIEGGNAYGTNKDAYGGGVLVRFGSPTLENLVLRSNAAKNGGGAACTKRSSPWLINVRFEQNIATDGGGFYSGTYCAANIQGASFSANRANYGGAIHSHGLIQAGNVSISGNTASQQGGGIYSTGYTPVVLNSIIWGNHQGQAANQIVSDSRPFVYNAIIEGGFDGYSIQDIDPAFMENPSGGPDGQWGTADDTPGFLDLRYNSPAIDKGQRNVYNSLRMTRDLKNWPRTIDHPRPDTPVGSFFDLGGYEAGVIHVRKEASGAANGSSWADAYPELSQAVDAVKHSNEIWVAAGLYKPGETRADTFMMHSDVGIYGGFAGSETLRSQRSWSLHPTILSGELGASSPDDNAYHVISAQETDSSATLDGFIIQDGNANGSRPPLNHGGGIYLEHAAPLLANLVFTDNQAIVGGGLYALSSSYHLSESTFTRNQAGYGGGIYQAGAGTPSLMNVLFTGNTATHYAGALFNDGNIAPDLSNIVMAGNQAATAGGIFNSNNSQATYRNITLAGNQGGAMHTFASSSQTTVTVVNMIAWENGPEPIITSRGSLVIRRSLVQYGCPGSANCDYVMAANPRLARLPSSGKDELWGTADDDYGDLRLAPPSQAIDAGDNSAVLPEVMVDFAGSPRFVNDPDMQDTGIGDPPIVDLGAYETNRGLTVISIDRVEPSPSVAGQEVRIFFHVAGGESTPAGTVTITSLGGSCTAPAGQASCAVTFQHSGDVDLKAVFTEDDPRSSSESAHITHRVNPADALVSLQLSPNPSALGQVVHAAFSVAPLAPGAGQPTGTVTVGTPPYSCTAALQEGGCDLPLTDTGIFSVIAQYSGDEDFNPSPSLPVTQYVSPASTTVQLFPTNPNPSVVGQAVTVRFQVNTPAGAPWGTVTVSDGINECSAAASAGDCAITFDTAGLHTLTAVYEDAYSPASSASAPAIHQVSLAGTVTTLVLSQSTDITVGQPVQARVSLQIQPPGAGLPSGEVEIGDGSANSCVAQVNGSGCSLVFQQAGAYAIRAHYRGSASFAASTSDPITLTVGYLYFLPTISR